MARMSKEARFELRTQNRRDAVKQLKARVAELNRQYRNTQSLNEQDVISEKIDFLNSVITKTVTNLNPKRRAPVRSIADVVESDDEQVGLYNNDRSSLAGIGDLVSAAA